MNYKYIKNNKKYKLRSYRKISSILYFYLIDCPDSYLAQYKIRQEMECIQRNSYN